MVIDKVSGVTCRLASSTAFVARFGLVRFTAIIGGRVLGGGLPESVLHLAPATLAEWKIFNLLCIGARVLVVPVMT